MESTNIFEECIELLKDRPTLYYGWKSKYPASLLDIVYYLYHIAERKKTDIFKLLDGLYTFVKKDRANVPDLEDADAIIEYLQQDEYEIHEHDGWKLPIDTQILLITKRAYEILERYESFYRFKRTMIRHYSRQLRSCS